ncbi:hypothetical protein PR202_gb29887 [Eleusine coracana subsp. coracana]|uniref:Uncharacterized protein n=1 Tax=Eleusine coracana subsp. coracana TaxID=191504 RepID=A0AAV5G165_ELECO|nr:hypothetical protein PR202_gb29887 [Eleusine coracana subsp. coracana]
MPRSSSSSSSGSKPILGRAMAILALPLTPISKAKGSLVQFKKRAASAAARRRIYKPFRHYNYAYVGEYQFSPSRSPLLPCPPPGITAWRRAAAKKRRSRARMILASLLCGGDELDVAVLDGLSRPVEVDAREREPLAPAALEWGRDEDACFDADDDVDEEYYYDAAEEEDGDEEVDGRAERFIQRFYEEMRLQRQRSLVQRLL